MLALLLTLAISQVEDVTELHERWQITESVYSDELSRYNKSIRERYEAIQREPNEARKRQLSDRLEAYRRDASPLLFGISRAVDRMRLKYLVASDLLPRAAS